MNVGQRGEFVRRIIGQVRDRKYPYEKRETKAIDWTVYDTAQCREIADVLTLIRELVDAAEARIMERTPPEPPAPGRPPTHAADVTKVLLAQSYFGFSNRSAEGILLLFSSLLGIRDTFSYKTIERGYDREAVDEILDEVFELSNVPVEGRETVFSIDGSGTPTRMRQNYAHDRERQRKDKTDGDKAEGPTNDEFPESPHDYVFSVAVIGTRYKLFASYRNAADHSKGEMSFLEEAVADTKALHPGMKMLTGDGIYANRKACRIVRVAGAIPRFLPRRDVRLKRGGEIAWLRMLLALSNDPDSWLREYFLREASETGFSMLKTGNPYPLRKRLDPRRCTEDRLRAVVMNIKRLCYIYYLENIEVVKPIRSAAG